MCWRAMRWVESLSGPKLAQKAVLMNLARRAGVRLTCFPSVATIAANTSMSERTVQRALRALEGDGYISITPNPAGRGSSTYTILVPGKRECEAPILDCWTGPEGACQADLTEELDDARWPQPRQVVTHDILSPIPVTHGDGLMGDKGAENRRQTVTLINKEESREDSVPVPTTETLNCTTESYIENKATCSILSEPALVPQPQADLLPDRPQISQPQQLALQPPAPTAQPGSSRRPRGKVQVTANRSRIPEGWQPDDAGKAYATARRIPWVSEAEKFRNYHEARGTLMASWPAAWRTWVGNAVQYLPESAKLSPDTVLLPGGRLYTPAVLNTHL